MATWCFTIKDLLFNLSVTVTNFPLALFFSFKKLMLLIHTEKTSYIYPFYMSLQDTLKHESFMGDKVKPFLLPFLKCFISQCFLVVPWCCHKPILQLCGEHRSFLSQWSSDCVQSLTWRLLEALWSQGLATRPLSTFQLLSFLSASCFHLFYVVLWD